MGNSNDNKKTMKISKLILIIIISLTTLFASNFVDKKVVYADSGYDFSYDSDSSSSSSDWGSSSSSSGGYSSYGSSGSFDGDEGGGFVLIIFIIIVVIVIMSIKKGNIQTSTYRPAITRVNDTEIENKIKQYIPDFNKSTFLQEGYDIYLDVQKAWTNFSLEDVRHKLTDEMFNMYESQLDTMEVKGEQNIMKGFNLISSNLKDVNAQNDNITITATFVVDFYDYITEKSTGRVLRGSASTKMRVTYDMKFRKTLNSKLSIDHCPNCGAKIEHINGAGVCEYCGSKIVSENSNWVLTDKKITNQRRA